MPVYMKYDEIDGDVATDGYAKWIELHSLTWGATRQVQSPMGKSADREATWPNVSEMTVTKSMNVSSNPLFEEAVGGTLDGDVKIALCTIRNKAMVELAQYTLRNTMISGYTLTTSGDTPLETLSLNFTQIEVKYTSLNRDARGNPLVSTYDLAQAKLNG